MAKNIGRANATTADEQAIFEANSKLEKKLKEGYFTTLKEAEEEEVILPMLAKGFHERKHKIDYESSVIQIQPKYDGMRCLCVVGRNSVKLISRQGNKIENMGHIENEILQKLGQYPGRIILDGELYVHGENFQTNMKYIKKYRKGKTERIQYFVYDVVMDQPFHKRFRQLITLMDSFNFNIPSSNVKLSHCALISSPVEKDVMECIVKEHKMNLANGYEGSIIRWGPEPYQFDKRSDSILKYKDFIDEIFIIINVVPNEKDPEQGTVVCTVNGHDFKCGMKMSIEERKQFLIDKEQYIGKKAEVRFFEYSEDGIPRFPIFHGIRLDK